MKEIRKKATNNIRKNLIEELKYLETLAYNSEINKQVFALVRKRIQDHLPFRPFFVHMIYLYVKSCIKKEDVLPFNREQEKHFDDLFSKEIPFIAELIIIIHYLQNQIQDGKGGVDNPTAIKNNYIASELLKTLLTKYIWNKFDRETSHVVEMYVRDIFEYANIGQYLEKEFNSYERFIAQDLPTNYKVGNTKIDKYLNQEPLQQVINQIVEDTAPEYRNYIDLYFKRMHLSNGALYVLMTDLVMELTGYKEFRVIYQGKELQNILSFAHCFGIMQQIINDNNDFIPSYFKHKTPTKTIYNGFSDMKNQLVTLPLIYHLGKTKNNKVKKLTHIHYLLKDKKQKFDKRCECVINDEIFKSHAIYKSMNIGKWLACLCEGFLHPKNDAFLLIKDALLKAGYNRYYFHYYFEDNHHNYYEKSYRKEYLDYKKSKHYKLIKQSKRVLSRLAKEKLVLEEFSSC